MSRAFSSTAPAARSLKWLPVKATKPVDWIKRGVEEYLDAVEADYPKLANKSYASGESNALERSENQHHRDKGKTKENDSRKGKDKASSSSAGGGGGGWEWDNEMQMNKRWAEDLQDYVYWDERAQAEKHWDGRKWK
ncbi:MAG: hypothetical protein M1818_004408 [Claussenomyces sp. TS43310]|nr:MAG: hypothetical protein M1818_004408 [Claussenomyces sp. TS43310]